jgi:hypothetical protein
MLLSLGDARAQDDWEADYVALSAPAGYVFGRQLEQRLFYDFDVTSSWYSNHSDTRDPSEDLSTSSFRVDVDRVIAQPGSNGEIGLGLGWQRQIGGRIGLDARDVDGPRISLVGRLQITDAVRLYGRTAWLPHLVDDELGEFEAGLFYDVRPSFSLRAGIRWFNDEDLDSDSIFGQRRFMLGAGMHW